MTGTPPNFRYYGRCGHAWKMRFRKRDAFDRFFQLDIAQTIWHIGIRNRCLVAGIYDYAYPPRCICFPALLSRIELTGTNCVFKKLSLQRLNAREIFAMDNKQEGRVTLRTVADHVGFTPGTISAVLNETKASQRIPQPTKDRIFAAARELNYQPN